MYRRIFSREDWTLINLLDNGKQLSRILGVGFSVNFCQSSSNHSNTLDLWHYPAVSRKVTGLPPNSHLQ
jgi:hypothetical protein